MRKTSLKNWITWNLFITTIVVCMTLCRTLPSWAADKVVIIPMGSTKPLKNVVTVAKGNGNFTDPVAAVNSITDASATNPYLVLIAPGIYTLTTTLTMKPYVDISGSGENVTHLTGPISTSNGDATSAVVAGANHATLSNLSISNTGGNSNAFGIYAKEVGNTCRFQNLTITVAGGSSSYGVFNDGNSSPTMTEMTITASGTSNNGGIVNTYHASPILTEVTVSAEGGTGSNFGVENFFLSSPKIRRSTLTGTTKGLYNSNSTATVSQSTITNGSTVTGSTCVACDNGSGVALTASCQ